jgi:hypothetical protein
MKSIRILRSNFSAQVCRTVRATGSAQWNEVKVRKQRHRVQALAWFCSTQSQTSLKAELQASSIHLHEFPQLHSIGLSLYSKLMIPRIAPAANVSYANRPHRQLMASGFQAIKRAAFPAAPAT